MDNQLSLCRQALGIRLYIQFGLDLGPKYCFGGEMQLHKLNALILDKCPIVNSKHLYRVTCQIFLDFPLSTNRWDQIRSDLILAPREKLFQGRCQISHGFTNHPLGREEIVFAQDLGHQFVVKCHISLILLLPWQILPQNAPAGRVKEYQEKQLR